MDCGVQEPLLGAAVKALALITAGQSVSLRNFSSDRVRQLNFTAGAAVNVLKAVENFGSRT